MADRINLLHFAYRASRSVKEATLIVVHHIASHLYKAGTSVRVRITDKSAAFQTIQHHVLVQSLRHKF